MKNINKNIKETKNNFIEKKREYKIQKKNLSNFLKNIISDNNKKVNNYINNTLNDFNYLNNYRMIIDKKINKTQEDFNNKNNSSKNYKNNSSKNFELIK